jgi:hypothetical protein
MKRSALILTLLLPALCAATAAAQVSSIRFAAPISPLAGMPTMLPSPLTGPLMGTGISLPTFLPSLTPSPILAPSPAAAALPAGIAPLSLPSREGHAGRVRDGGVDPLRRVLPGVTIRFAAAGTPAKPVEPLPGVAKRKLDETFDGEGQPVKPAVDREPVASGRRIGIPELDLERELGL